MEKTEKKNVKKGRKIKLLLPAAAALIWLGLVILKDSMSKVFLSDYYSTAKSIYYALNTCLMDDKDSKTPRLPAGDYLAFGRVKDGTVTIRRDGPSFLQFSLNVSELYDMTAEDWNFSYRVKDGAVTQVRVSKRDNLRNAPETGHFYRESDEKLTMAEFYGKTFVAYYPET